VTTQPPSGQPTGQPVQIDRYRLIRKIRQVGAYYTVFEAIQKYLERTVELRVLNVKLEEDSPEFLRFAQEFRTVANLNHPNCLRILDLGLTADRIYYICDWRNAQSLDAMMTAGREFTLKETIHIGKSLASALAYMHNRKVLHRSLTADSIYYDEEADLPYISEFSLVKNLKMDNLSSVGVPQMVEMLKTPEFAQGLELTERTDIYCLGTVLFKLLTHHAIKTKLPPTTDKDEQDRRLHPRSFNNLVPEELDSVIYRCIRFDPADRFASATALREALTTVEEKVVVRGSLMKMSGEINLEGLRGSLEKQQQAVEKAKETKAAARASQRVRALPEGGEEGGQRRTTRSNQVIVPQSKFQRHKSLIGMIAVLLVVGGGVGWAVWERVALASIDEPEMITSGIRKGLRQKAPAVVKTYDEDLRKEIAAVKLTASTVFTFQDRWYLLDNWTKQLAREKKQPPFTPAELMKVRQDTYVDQAKANIALDQMFRKADDYLDDNRGAKPAPKK
jgi:serine/threonine protein kinase